MEQIKPQMTNRKFKGFVITQLSLILIFIGALFTGTTFTGDNIIVFGALLAATGGAFFGANFGEHWAAAKRANGTK